ncbi:hypothetical protein MKW94_000010, partial [Papaver nudicaule]|nr:hypothetical protein [Papaver nudicaule]
MFNRTPKNMPCLAMFWGPHGPPNTGLAVVQSLADKKAAFRFLGKASVLYANQGSEKIVKKSKRIGTPCKISNKTALVKDMFSSDLEIANFRGTKIQTTSGICGKMSLLEKISCVKGLLNAHLNTKF